MGCSHTEVQRLLGKYNNSVQFLQTKIQVAVKLAPGVSALVCVFYSNCYYASTTKSINSFLCVVMPPSVHFILLPLTLHIKYPPKRQIPKDFMASYSTLKNVFFMQIG